MNDIQKELEQAWKLLESIPVQGGAVDIMAAVRVGLRRAYQMSEESGVRSEELPPAGGTGDEGRAVEGAGPYAGTDVLLASPPHPSAAPTPSPRGEGREKGQMAGG